MHEMTPAAATDWHATNQRYLEAELARVSAYLDGSSHSTGSASERQARPGAEQFVTPALDVIGATFGLSGFERDVLLLCAGIELDARFGSLCATAHGDPQRPYPTFGLALAALPDAHWSALTPVASLRYWRLIDVEPGMALTQARLRIDERILHYLVGVQVQDARLAGLIEPVPVPARLVPSHGSLADQVSAVWTWEPGADKPPAVQLCGRDREDKYQIAAAACASLGLGLRAIDAQALPLDRIELDALIRLWVREAALGRVALLLDCDGLREDDPSREALVARMIDTVPGWLVISGRQRQRTHRRPTVTLDVAKPTSGEQRALWDQALGSVGASLNGQLNALVAQFSLAAPAIQVVALEAASRTDGMAIEMVLWDTCRAQARPHLDDLAQRIECVATWEDLVLPEAQLQTLHEIAMHVRQRAVVYESWGFAQKSPSGLGTCVLFTGASGTGKTFAAEILANDLQLDLYHIDLSQVVSKYIGETEKNLRRVFDAAEDSGAVLLFDEADALFGSRTEVRDSHDRYANIEVSYLLQRMEAYRGLAILTTNMKNAIDPAFLRRIRTMVQFPFPDVEARAEIWRRVFPLETPTEDLDVEKLAQLSVTGGHIRNIALNAAFLAAHSGEPVRMEHLLRAARVEYMKLEHPLSEAEIGGWV